MNGYRGFERVNPFTTGNPFLGTKLLGFSIGRGSGALKGLRWTGIRTICFVVVVPKGGK